MNARQRNRSTPGTSSEIKTFTNLFYSKFQFTPFHIQFNSPYPDKCHIFLNQNKNVLKLYKNKTRTTRKQRKRNAGRVRYFLPIFAFSIKSNFLPGRKAIKTTTMKSTWTTTIMKSTWNTTMKSMLNMPPQQTKIFLKRNKKI